MFGCWLVGLIDLYRCSEIVVFFCLPLFCVYPLNSKSFLSVCVLLSVAMYCSLIVYRSSSRDVMCYVGLVRPSTPPPLYSEQMSAPAPATKSDAKDSKSGGGALFDNASKSNYDVDTRRRIIGYDDMHHATPTILGAKHLAAATQPQKILCVGCGSGQEVITLTTAIPTATAAPLSIVGVDPSAKMLEMARTRLAAECSADQNKRVELITGYLNDLDLTNPKYTGFDAATSLLVMHFIPDVAGPTGKAAYLKSITQRLKVGARLFHVDVCGDITKPEFIELIDTWCEYVLSKGSTPEFVKQMKELMTEGKITKLVSEERVRQLLGEAGFVKIKRVYQGFQFTGFMAQYAGEPTPTPTQK